MPGVRFIDADGTQNRLDLATLDMDVYVLYHYPPCGMCGKPQHPAHGGCCEGMSKPVDVLYRRAYVTYPVGWQGPLMGFYTTLPVQPFYTSVQGRFYLTPSFRLAELIFAADGREIETVYAGLLDV